ncbi:MAG: hypothetical protein ABEH35_02800 [Haloarculaceae archaeon]
MSTAGRDTASPPAASDVAGQLREAGFVRLVAAATGDAVAATGTLARALDDDGTPFQATVAGPFADPDRDTEADLTVAVGRADPVADVAVCGPDPTSVTAFEVARELGDTPDPTLALAGAIAAGERSGMVAEAAEQAGIERRPGVAVPVADLADGLAHSTLIRAPYSGDADGARDALSERDIPATHDTLAAIDEETGRRLASLVALDVTGSDDATPRAASAVERALRPYVGGPFGTVGGYADVLDAVARERPGTAVALALGHDAVRDGALDAWRTHARQAHAAVRESTTGRYDGLFVARGDAMPVETVARLVAEFRSPEPVTLVVTDGEAAARATDERDLADVAHSVADAVGGQAATVGDGVRLRFDVDTADLIMAFREAL